AMAQAAGVLAFRTEGGLPTENSLYYYAGIDNARFKKPVVPGDQLEIEVVVQAVKRNIWKFACVAKVDGGIVAQADILCTLRAAPQEKR
ncbi:MAG: hotdog domain-containing protein, partial [Sphingomonadaceae bacterium]